jgi:hypothetical protein
MRLGLLLALSLTGCAHKQSIPITPGVHKYAGCREMGIDVKRDVMLIECPLEKK